MNLPKSALIRADAGPAMGTGHVMRCLTLADELSARGWSVVIASAELPLALEVDVVRRGHSVLRIGRPGDYGAAEASCIADQLPGPVDLAIVDHYRIGSGWHEAARAWARSIAAIDDLADRPLSVDLVLNQNLGERTDAYRHLVRAGTRLLVGSNYALVRPQFRHARRSARIPRVDVRRLFVFISGADERNVTETAARAAGRVGISTDVVIGAAYPHEAALRRWARNEHGIVLHQNVSEMAALMARADLAIGAPSSASWERCCVGLPTVLVTLAENQVRAARALAERRAALSLGWHHDVNEQAIVDGLEELIQNPEQLSAMSNAAAAIADGRGVIRVCGEIEAIQGEQNGR